MLEFDDQGMPRDASVTTNDRARATEGLSLGQPGELRILYLSHMEPRISKGGAEFAAFQLYEEVAARPGVRAFFMSCAPGRIEPRAGVTFSQPFGEDNYVYAMRDFDHFIFSNGDSGLRSELTELLHELRPDVVHMHHYTNFGLEFLQVVRDALPDARIVMTVHEYLAICNHYGQMVKRGSFALCEKSGPRECHGCYPEISPQDFFLRELFIKRFLRLVDTFVAPSAFLARRYAGWGLPADKIAVVENGVPRTEERGLLPYPSTDDGLVFGFFGQISRLKGIGVLIEAAGILHARGTRLRIEVHGDYSSQPEEFRQAFLEQLADAPPNFFYAGPYSGARIDALMQSVHAVLVPSIWWENSPLVIQEAFANRRPVITSDIGGMAEKVRDGVDGFFFQAGSAGALAALLQRLENDPARLAAVQAGVVRPPSIEETADRILDLYAGVDAA